MIYLAHAIDKTINTRARMDAAIKDIRGNGYKGSIFVPSAAFSVVPDRLSQREVEAIVAVNYSALKRSEVMMLDYLPGVESWGVPQELMLAHRSSVPVILRLPKGTEYLSLPVYLKAWVPEANSVTSWYRALELMGDLCHA